MEVMARFVLLTNFSIKGVHLAYSLDGRQGHPTSSVRIESFSVFLDGSALRLLTLSGQIGLPNP